MNRHLIYLVWLFWFVVPAASAQNTEGIFPSSNAQRWGYRSPNGDTLIPFRYREVYFFSEGLAVVRTQGHYGYIDADGQTVIPEIYDRATPFQNGHALVRRHETNFLIDTEGRELFSFKGNEAHFWGDVIVYQNPQSFYVDRMVLNLKGEPLMSGSTYEYLYLYTAEYPLLTVIDREGYSWLKNKEGKRITRVGRYFHNMQTLCGNLFTYGTATYKYRKQYKPQNPNAILGADTLRIFSPEGRLLKTITAGPGFYFKNTESLPGRPPYGVYNIRKCSVKSLDDWEDQFYDPQGNLLHSIRPGQYPEAFEKVSGIPDFCPSPAPDTNRFKIPDGYINPEIFGCTDSLYISPHTGHHFSIPYIEKTETPTGHSTQKWSLIVNTTPTLNRNGCSSHRVTLRNASGKSVRLQDIKHVHTQLLKKDSWMDFYPYYMDNSIQNTAIANNESLTFPVYALYGSYQTQMRVYVKIPDGKGQFTTIYSNPFAVGLNPDFRLPEFVRNIQTF